MSEHELAPRATFAQGASGATMRSGRYTGPVADHNSDIAEEQGYGTPYGDAGLYEKMYRTVPSVSLLIRLFAMPIRAFPQDFRYEPQTPQRLRSKEILDRVRRCYFDDLEDWENHNATSVLSLLHGFEPFEVEDGLALDGAYTWKRFLYRAPFSVLRIFRERERLAGIVQRTQLVDDGPIRDVPIGGDRLLWYTHGLRGDHFTGLSIARPALGPWREIINAWRCGGMKIERSSVITPWAALGPDSWQDEEYKDDLADTQKGMRASAFSYLQTRGDDKLQNLGGDAKVDDVVQWIRMCSWQILECGAGQFLALGTTDTGSRAVGDVHAQVLWRSFRAVCYEQSSPLNRRGERAGLGTIKRFVDANFGEQQAYPIHYYVVPRADSFVATADALSKLRAANFLHPVPGDEEVLRDEYDMPTLSEEELVDIADRMKRDAVPPADTSMGGTESRPA